MRLNRLWLLLFIGVLFYAHNTYAGCCVNYLSEECSTTSTSAQCIPPNVYFSESCDNIPEQCTVGCCCLSDSTGGSLVFNQSCQISQGVFQLFPNTQPECTDFCSGAPTMTYSLNGIVTNNSFPADGAMVTLLNRDGRTYTTGTNGYYIFDNVASGLVSVSAQKDECSWSGNIELNDDTTFDIALNCCSYTCSLGACIDGLQENTCTAIDPLLCSVDTYTETIACQANLCEWDCSEWSPPESEACPPGVTQRTRTCTAIHVNNCQEGPTPDITKTCEAISSVCGNGIIEPGEQCDFSSDGTGESNCRAPYNTVEWCSSNADLNTCKCIYPSPDLADCINNPLPTPPGIILSADAVFASRNIDLTWISPECNDYVDHYAILGCANEGCSPSYIFDANNLPKETVKYTVTDTISFPLYAETTYCFILETTFNELIDPNIQKIYNSDPVCITLGNETCLSPHIDKWCGESINTEGDTVPAVLSCNEDNFIQYNLVCSADDEFCGFINGALGCVQGSSECERCNGVFGIFGYQGLSIDVTRDSIVDTLKCPGALLDNKLARYYSDDDFAGCYLDYSYTTVDKTYSCSDTISCYDYKSRDSCENDYCKTFEYGEDNICEWNYYSTIFNKGVCRPKKEYVDLGLQEQHCEYCDEPSYNRIYSACTADTCGLYGYCYYKESSEKCIDGYDVVCSDYPNQEDCNGGVNVLVDTTWNSLSTIKTGGTNKVLSNSADILGILRCEWDAVNEKCFRNADNLTEEKSSIFGRDCGRGLSNEQEILCERDNVAPTTTVQPKLYYGEVMDLTNSVNVADNIPWPLGDDLQNLDLRNSTWIYYCFIIDTQNFGGTCYPNKILSVNAPSPDDAKNFKIILIPSREIIYDGVDATLFYMAEDPAKNLELIKNFTFTLDLVPPDVKLTTHTEVYPDDEFPGEDKSLIDFFINITLNAEKVMPVMCYFNITPENPPDENYWTEYLQYNLPSPYPPLNNLIGTVPGEVNTVYFGIQPDNYDYEFKCIDDVGNYVYQHGTYVLEGDLTITSPYPSGDDVTFRTDTLPEEISIHTTVPAVCRYSMDTVNYEDMQGEYTQTQITDTDYLQSDEMSSLFPELLTENQLVPSGIYRVYTACNLTVNGINKIQLGESSDIIRFAVDDLAPKTILEYDPSNGGGGELQNYANNQSTDLLHLYLSNDDSSPLLIDIAGTDMSFGSNQTFYCITLRDGTCTMQEYDLDPLTKSPIILDYFTEGSDDNVLYGPYPEFCYYSTDNGANAEPTKCITLNVRNLEFSSPDITIIPTE